MSNVPNTKPPNQCTACAKSIRTVQQMQCSKCASYFHAICVNVVDLRNFTEEARQAWTCPACKVKLPKLDNSHTPVRGATPGDPTVPSSSACSRKQNAPVTTCSPAMTANPDPLMILTAELKLMRDDIGDMKTQMRLLSEDLASSLDAFSSKYRELEARDAAREVELCSLRATVSDLQSQLNYRAQAGLKNELEISGITEKKEENLMHITRVTAKKIGVDMQDGDIDFVMRVGPLSTVVDDSTLPRPVVIRFVRRHTRDAFLSAAKNRRSLVTTDIEVEGPSSKLYFNERLTQENRKLFRIARLRSKEAGFKYCWVKNGTIYLRRQEGCPAITIKSSANLDSHLEPKQADQPALIP